MGMGNANPSGQVFYDPQKQQYYTHSNVFGYGSLHGNPGRDYIGSPLNQTTQQVSPINALLAQSLAAKPNAPTLAQLFPTMGGMYNNANGLLGGFTGAGQYGAGRFLGNNVMGNPSLTSTAMNVT